MIDGEEVFNVLKDVKDPECNVSIIDLGLVHGVEIERNVAIIYVNFNNSLPSCKACVPLAWMVVRAILRDMGRAMKRIGVRYRIVERATGVIYQEG